MATGELATTANSSVVPWDRVPQVGPAGEDDQPLTTTQLELLDDVIREAERFTGLRFSAYLGDLGSNTRGSPKACCPGSARTPRPLCCWRCRRASGWSRSSPEQRRARRVSDRAARLAVLAVVSSCTDGDISGALVTGIRILADQAGTLPERSTW